MKLIIKSDLKELEALRHRIRHFCVSAAGFSRDDQRLDRVELGIHEMIVNIIKHAYDGESGKKIQISARLNKDRIVFELIDQGKSFNPDSIPKPCFDGSRENGFGMYLADQIFDRIEYSQNADGENRTVLSFSAGGN